MTRFRLRRMGSSMKRYATNGWLIRLAAGQDPPP